MILMLFKINSFQDLRYKRQDTRLKKLLQDATRNTEHGTRNFFGLLISHENPKFDFSLKFKFSMKSAWSCLNLMLIISLLSCEKENAPPQARFSIDPTSGNNETIFNFDASGSSDPDDPIEKLVVQWDWEGDDFFDTPFATRKTADHLFADPGEYMVIMVVKDPRGMTDTLKQALIVSNANLPPNPPSNPSPESEAAELGVNIYCSWECIDPEGDLLLYTINFGTSNPPELHLSNYAQNSFDPGKLEYGTTYYWNVKARDSKGNTVEGPLWKFTTIDLNFGTLTDSRDGKSYSTIEIGTTWWMAENMNYATEEGSYCYEDIESYCTRFGRLYKWESAMLACPEGWHLPTQSEFEAMVDYLGGPDVAGGRLKDYNPGTWNSPNLGATNISGFGALPAGRRYGEGNYTGYKYYAQFFSATEYGSEDAYNLTLGYDYEQTYIYNFKKKYAISVRCVKD